jgi:hypothetical protein
MMTLENASLPYAADVSSRLTQRGPRSPFCAIVEHFETSLISVVGSFSSPLFLSTIDAHFEAGAFYEC